MKPVTWNPDGSFNLELEGFSLSGCRSLVRSGSDGERAPAWEIAEEDDAGMRLTAADPLGRLELAFDWSGSEKVTIQLSVELAAENVEYHLIPLALPVLEADHLVSQGPGMGRCRSIAFPAAESAPLEGYYLLMLRRGRRYLELSTPVRREVGIRFLGRPEISGVSEFRADAECLFFSRRRVTTDLLTLRTGTEPFRMMEQWADINTEVRKKFDQPVDCGWNSWDYYRWTISEEEVLRNAEFIARDPVLSKRIKRIIVDDGWQYCYGEWQANPRFPNGMRYLAAELAKMGFEPGLWFAPSIVEPHTRIAQLDSDLLALSDGGQPCLAYECMRRYGFVLDPTVPASRKFVRDLFDEYAGMGYKYFKLDFLGSTLKARQFHDRSVPRSEIIRLIVESAWEGIAGRASILGCNYFFEAGNRFVDAVRIGADIHSCWQNLRINAVSVAARYWSNRRWWINDPDFALARALDTSDDPDLNRLKCALVYVEPTSSYNPGHGRVLVDNSRPQAEILLSIVLCAAGAVNLSDNLPRLNASGLDLVHRTISAEPGEAAVPLDLFETELPSRWLQKIPGGHRLLLINWSDEPREMEFDFAPHGIRPVSAVDFWNDATLPLDGSRLRTRIAPRSCRFAVVR